MSRAVVFGASGQTGKHVCRLLAEPDVDIVAVSRSGTIDALSGLSAVGSIGVVKCDVHDAKACAECCADADMVFCCLGVEYNVRVMEREWEGLLANVLNATPSGAVFVMSDSLYLFGPEAAGQLLKPDTPFSKTGRLSLLRARMHHTMFDAHKAGKCNVVSIRASDFFGPEAQNSHLGATMMGRIVEDKAPQFFQPITQPHAFTYLPDFAAAMVLAAATPASWGRAYHCPNSTTTSLAELTRMAQREAGVRERKPMVVTGALRSAFGMFMPAAATCRYVEYTFAQPFRVDTSSFEAMFPDSGLPTPIERALPETVNWFKEHAAAGKT